MTGLRGLDASLARLDCRRLSPTESSRVAALQSGALMFAEAQAKFDLTRSGLCHVPDNKEHRLLTCPLFAAARVGHEATIARWAELPPCLKFHLLPPANSAAAELRALLHGTPDGSCSFLSRPSVGVQHLFTDGACSRPASAELAVAAWSVVNATTGNVVASDHLPGILQTAPRAELFAVLSAVSWVRSFRVQGVIWGDSLSVVEGLSFLLEGQAPDPAWSNYDLWQRLWDQLTDLERGQLRTQHVPSHLDANLCETAFEEWVACWNQFADTTATITNANRTWPFQQVQQRALNYFEDTAAVLRSLRSLYLKIAEHVSPDEFRDEQAFEYDEHEPPDDFPAELPRSDPLTELLPLTWKSDFTRGITSAQGVQACRQLQTVIDQDACSVVEFNVSWLELVGVLWVLDARVWFTQTGSDERIPVPAPTVAEQLRRFRRTGLAFLEKFGFAHKRVYRLSRVSLGFAFPVDGIRIGVVPDVLRQARTLLKDFASGRFCQSVADLEGRF